MTQLNATMTAADFVATVAPAVQQMTEPFEQALFVKAAINHQGAAARHLILEPGVAALVAMALAEKDDLGFLRDAAVDTTVES